MSGHGAFVAQKRMSRGNEEDEVSDCTKVQADTSSSFLDHSLNNFWIFPRGRGKN